MGYNNFFGPQKRGQRISTKRLKKDPAFQKFRDNGKAMGAAAKASKTLRLAFRLQLKDVADKQVTQRLNQLMRKIIDTDLTNPKGDRTVTDGNIEMLRGFEFNLKGRLSTMLFAPYNLTFDRTLGKIQIKFSPLIPERDLATPSAATHFKLIVAVSGIDFGNRDHNTKHVSSSLLAVTSSTIEGLNFEFEIIPATSQPVVVLFGIEFYEQLGDELVLLKSAASRAVAVVEVFAAK